MSAPERALKPAEVAERLQVSVRTVQREIREGRLKACRIGSSKKLFRVTPQQLADYMQREAS